MSAPIVDIVPEKPASDRIYRLSPDTVTVIGHDTEDTDEHELWDERISLPLNEEQILSFMAVGVQVPLLARRGPTGRIEIIDGRRRTIEGREANRRLIALGEIPIVLLVRFGAVRLSRELQRVLSVEINERRTEDPPAVKQRKALRMLAAKIDIRTVARAFGVTTKAIENWRVISEASPNLQAAADLGMIPASAVAELARAPEPEAALEELLNDARPTRTRAAAIARAARTGSSSSKLPRGALRRVLATKGIFTDDFLDGIRFAKGDLDAKEVQAILERAK